VVCRLLAAFAGLLATVLPSFAQTPDQVLVVVNQRSRTSREIGEYYLHKREIPLANLCTIKTEPEEIVDRNVYNQEIDRPIGQFLRQNRLTEKILYIVLTTGVPLGIKGESGTDTLTSDAASVDSELTLLYQRLHGVTTVIPGPVTNPFFRQRDTPFRHPQFPIYLVTRLDGYNMADMKALVDRSLAAQNTGKFAIDLREDNDTPGNQWLRAAALLIPRERLVLEETGKVLTDAEGVIAYASWGSNDRAHKQRFLHFKWLPGAIATEFVSTDARTFRQPPEKWQIGTWPDKNSYYAGSPQSMTADFIHEGASAASGQVFEPFLAFCPRPDFVLPAYYSGRTLAESFYLGIPGLSWMNVVVGDPLMRLK
jgi:uncharacterized protein (TIGR03790 family)